MTACRTSWPATPAHPKRSSSASARAQSSASYSCHHGSRAACLAHTTTSRAVSVGRSRSANEALTTPTRRRWTRTSTRPTTPPSTSTRPAVGCKYIDAMRTSVVFPEPFAPSSTQRSPSPTHQSMPSRIVVSPRSRRTPDSRRAGDRHTSSLTSTATAAAPDSRSTTGRRARRSTCPRSGRAMRKPAIVPGTSAAAAHHSSAPRRPAGIERDDLQQPRHEEEPGERGPQHRARGALVDECQRRPTRPRDRAHETGDGSRPHQVRRRRRHLDAGHGERHCSQHEERDGDRQAALGEGGNHERRGHDAGDEASDREADARVGGGRALVADHRAR